MASIRETVWKDGKTVTYQVLWRENGKQTSAPFNDFEVAKAFKGLVESQGSATAHAWLERLEAADNPADAVVTLNAGMEYYIDHITGIGEGTRDEYHRLYRRTWGRATCDATGGQPLGQQPREAITKDMLSEVIIHDLGKRLKLKSIKNARGLLSQAYSEWIDDPKCLVEYNPCRRLALPKMEYDEEELEDDLCLLTHDEFQLIFDELDDRWKPLVEYLVGTGARWSEATALDVRRILVDNGTGPPKSRIVRSWKKIPGGHELGPPKTRRSIRDIDLQPELLPAVEFVIKDKKPGDFAFTAREGGPVHRNNFYNRVWLPALWRAGLCKEHRAHACGCVLRTPRRCKRHDAPMPEPCGCPGTLRRKPRIHDFRHTHVAWMVAADAQLPWVSRRLGHESIQTTWDIYGDLLPQLREASMEIASKAMAGVSWFMPQQERVDALAGGR